MSGEAAASAIRIDDDDEEEDEDYIPDDEIEPTAEEKEVIAKRTRAQHSLKETAWEELERWLNEQNSPSPPGTPLLDETQSLYADFLARLRDPGPTPDDGAETDAGEDDLDFVPQEEEAEKKIEDDIGRDAAPFVSKAEISALLAADHQPRGYQSRKKKPKVPAQPKLLAPKVVTVVPPVMTSTALTESQLSQLRSQIAAHTQLLIQSYVMARPNPELALVAEQQYAMLQTLVHYRNLSDQIYLSASIVRASSARTTRRAIRSRPSVFNTPLLEKVQLLPLPPMLARASAPSPTCVSVPEHRAAGGDTSSRKSPPFTPAKAHTPTTPATPGASVPSPSPSSSSQAPAPPPTTDRQPPPASAKPAAAAAAAAAPAPTVPSTQLSDEDTEKLLAVQQKYPLLAHFAVHLDPAYVMKVGPPKRKLVFCPPKQKPCRNQFSPEDDEQLLQGLRKYGRNAWSQIQSEFLPKKTLPQIINRFRNAVTSKSPHAAHKPLRQWFEESQKPLTPDEEKKLLNLADEHKMQWELIARSAFPNRSSSFLRTAYFKLRPRPTPNAAQGAAAANTANAKALPAPLPLPLDTSATTAAHTAATAPEHRTAAPPSVAIVQPLPLPTSSKPEDIGAASAAAAAAAADEWEIEELSSGDEGELVPSAKAIRLTAAPVPHQHHVAPTNHTMHTTETTTRPAAAAAAVPAAADGDFEVEELLSDHSDDEKAADNVLIVHGRRLYFTRDEDREILLASLSGATESCSTVATARWGALIASGKVAAGKTATDIEERYKQLLHLQARAAREAK